MMCICNRAVFTKILSCLFYPNSSMDRLPDFQEPSDDDLDMAEDFQRECTALSRTTEAEVKNALLGEPGKMLLTLLSEPSPTECRRKASLWICEQKLQGRLGSLTEANEPACHAWMEQMRWQWLKEAFVELESLRTYRATAEEDIQRAIRSINAAAAASMRYSHH